MAGHSLRTRLTVRYRLTPWWAKVLVVFAASRVVTTTLMLSFAARQGANPWTGAQPGYTDFARIWDGNWYNIIAVVGYPSAVPITDDGHVGENAWAFMPGYPALVRLLLVLGLDFGVAAVIVSTTFALGAALVFYRLMARFLPGEAALFSVVLFCFAPLSPILQVAYAESMFLFLLVVALYLLVLRRYWVLIPVVAAMAVTRPGALAFALVLLLHVIHRWWLDRTGREPFPARERIAAIVSGLSAAALGLAWLLIAGLVTGRLSAYVDTELAWRSVYVGYDELVPFTPWFRAAEWWANWWGLPPVLLIVALVLVIALWGVLLFSPPARRLGVDIRFWLVSYSLYLLAVFFPQSSTFRLLMPLFPALGALAQPRSPVYRVVLVILCILGQFAWIDIAWWVDGRDWTPP
ncbi:hypothetical protein HDC94_001330 [Leifsonia sp. AK011]|uniref:mannosyltransferase family protein n=1 Tax=Leifsonia sp. AK011 TaxID=2723075 RepID=UPI0017C67057|nr:mannosyltransferase family protein [Leifsonia sp. AK011]NYF10174.1 hypothetical protein [Leifsonia sp. AK011]